MLGHNLPIWVLSEHKGTLRDSCVQAKKKKIVCKRSKCFGKVKNQKVETSLVLTMKELTLAFQLN